MGIYDKPAEATDFELEGKDDYLMRPGYGGKTLKQIHRAEHKREKDTTQALISPDAVGANEMEAVSDANAVTPPLVLNESFVAQSPSYVARFQAAYNSYTTPMRQTLYGMGRLKDLQSTGAPLSPEELKADKRLARKFRPLSQTRNHKRGRHGSDGAARNAFNQWSETQSEWNINYGSFRQSQREMATAVKFWNRARLIIQRRGREAEKANKEAEKAKIDDAAETLARIVDVSTEAWSAYNALTSFASSAQEVKDTSGPAPALGEGLTTGALEEAGGKHKGAPWHSRSQAAARGASSFSKKFGETVGIVNKNHFTEMAKKNNPITLKDVFIVAMGDAGKYMQLEADIARLKSQIANLNNTIEVQEIQATWDAMNNAQWNVALNERTVTHSTRQARKSAQAFNQNMDGGAKGLMAMYACEAYQELAQVGDEAYRDVHRVTHLGGYVNSFGGRHRYWMEAEGYFAEMHNLRNVLRRTSSQKKLLEKRSPEWDERAMAWREFLANIAGSDLMTAE